MTLLFSHGPRICTARGTLKNTLLGMHNVPLSLLLLHSPFNFQLD